MIKKTFLFFFGLALVWPVSILAQGKGDRIASFDSQISVQADNSVQVTERIVYDTGAFVRHGMYRDIYPYSSQKRKMDIKNIMVTDENGAPYHFTVSNNGDYLRLKIGDADKTFTGQKTYIIRYQATQAVGQYEKFDEIYWNATGNNWEIPIYQAQATVVLPGISSIQSACYYGPKGSTNQCPLISSTTNTYTFQSPTTLNAKEGLTVAVGFSKGVVAPYTASDETAGFFAEYGKWLLAALLPLLTLIFSLHHWYKYGRDPKGTGVIVPQYDVPDNLTPMEVAGIVNEEVNAKQISAEIIYLATKGYLKISQTEETLIGIFHNKDYQLTKLKPSDGLQSFDKNLLDSLFAPIPKIGFVDILLKKDDKLLDAAEEILGEKSAVKLSDLKNRFYKNIPPILKSAAEGLKSKGYYKNLGKLKSGLSGRSKVVAGMSAIGAFIAAFLFIGPVSSGSPVSVAGIIGLSFIIYFIVSLFFAARTEKGVAAKEYLLGLKDYLQIAEKDRLLFHNAPEKKPEIFEQLLPYAMVLGVADIWAKEFEGILTVPPEWYSGPVGSHFSAVAFAHDMSSFSSYTSSSLSSAPGSGSGGGGSSVGGGGGGGGGGW